jgi:hypothetical protein
MFVSQNLIIFIDKDNNKYALRRSVQSILYVQSILLLYTSIHFNIHKHCIGKNPDKCNQKQL